MKILTITKLLLILILPFLLFLLVLNFFAFYGSFYQKEFSKLGIEKEVPNAKLLHEKVIGFLKGNTDTLPNDFNQREKSHLSDVKELVRNASIIMYFLIISFVLFSVVSIRIIGNNKRSMNFIGEALLYGGLLSIIMSAALFFSVSFGFSDVFDLFHKMFFTQGTYVFDPANEIIVRLYPEQLFMDLGASIFGLFMSFSILIMLLGAFLTARSKKNKKDIYIKRNENIND